MITKRQARRRLMAELKEAYQEMDTAEPFGDDWDAVSQAIGRYDGLKRAYVILTSRDATDVSNEVVDWYVTTHEYQARKQEETS